jgi:hypothetical protein
MVEKTTQKTYTYMEDNIKMDLKGRGCDGLELIHLSQDKDQ